jgi:tetratricopeptide (TPR) repeat protein
VLIELPNKKSPYYQAAIRYYKGLLAKLSFDEQKAFRYHKYVIDSKQTQYWYSLTQMYLKYPMDSLLYKQIYNRNLLYNRNSQNSLKKALELKTRVESSDSYENPDLPYLVTDLIGEIYFFRRQYRLAKETYAEIVPNLYKMEDEFRKSWIYIRYAKCLRELGDYETAEKMLNTAHRYEDDFTRLIISREKYLVDQLKEKNKKV